MSASKIAHSLAPWHVLSTGWHHIEGPRREHIGTAYVSIIDAHMMAASPELLEVAELVLARDPMIQVSTELEEKARIAVDKAKGLIL